MRRLMGPVKRALRNVGLNVSFAPSGWSAANVRKHFRPQTLVDVGVARGTPRLYAAFPEAYLVLLEPVPFFKDHIEKILSTRRGEHIACAVGGSVHETKMTVEKERPGKSSLYTRTELTAEHGTKLEITVPVRTLDSLIAEHDWKRPYGLKIDVEGGELEVIRGAGEFLKHCEMVIAELSVAPRFQNSYKLADFFSEMNTLGYRLFDVLDMQRTRQGEIVHLDAVFVPDTQNG